MVRANPRQRAEAHRVFRLAATLAGGTVVPLVLGLVPVIRADQTVSLRR